jgi:hypothetical protein
MTRTVIFLRAHCAGRVADAAGRAGLTVACCVELQRAVLAVHPGPVVTAEVAQRELLPTRDTGVAVRSIERLGARVTGGSLPLILAAALACTVV